MSDIRQAASIILARGRHADSDVFLVRRSPKLRFFGGFWAFPGGAIEDVDRHADTESPDDVLLRCAVRELYEETGVLLDESWCEGPRPDAGARRDLADRDPAAWRRGLAAPAALADRFATVCDLTTPRFSAIRFQTRFYHAIYESERVPVVDQEELVEGRYILPSEAVALWENHEIRIAPPALFLLGLLARYDLDEATRLAREAAESAQSGAPLPTHFSPGISTVPLATPTLPPATTTNTIFVGTDRFYIIDPATPDEEEQQHLFASVDARRDGGAEPAAILLTHHHADHVGAVTALSRRYELPVRAHALCYDRIPPGFVPGEPLADGDTLELGTAPDGSAGWHLRVIETPGHASDHLCFQESRYKAAVVGDMLSTLSTIVIDPPDGHLRTYLDSLQRLLEHDITTLYPAHGMPHPKGNTLIKSYLAHRKVREQQLLAALSSAPQTMHDILPTVYPEIPETVYPIALRSLLAGLTKLAEDGLASESDRGWRLAG